MHPQINWPPVSLRTRERDGRVWVFDEFRQKWVLFTPEENIRQHVAHYLVGQLGYPRGLVSLERQMKLNGLVKRWDILCFNAYAEPKVLVECKEPGVAISQSVFHQAMRYNLEMNAPYLLVTNGVKTYVLHWENRQYKAVDHIPRFAELA